MDHRSTFPLMFGKVLTQATQLPRKMMEWMRLMFVHCASRSTPAHFVGNTVKIILLSVLTHTLGEKCMRAARRSVCGQHSLSPCAFFCISPPSPPPPPPPVPRGEPVCLWLRDRTPSRLRWLLRWWMYADPLGHRVPATLKIHNISRDGLVNRQVRCSHSAMCGARGACVSLCGDKTICLAQCMSRVLRVEFTALVFCCVLYQEGSGVDSGLLWGLPEGRVKLGLKLGYLVHK